MNKKTALIAAVMCLVAVVVLVVSLNSGTLVKAQSPEMKTEATLATEPQTPLQETVEDELTVVEAPVLAIPETGKAVFGSLEYSIVEDKLAMQGSVYDLATEDAVATAPLNLYCGGAIIGTGATDENGGFSLNAYGQCETGIEVWAQVIYKETAYDSEHSTFVQLENYEHKVTHHKAAVPTTGVPEFSTLTLGIAVVVVCLGLAFLRKE
jgi:hypothetical protein